MSEPLTSPDSRKLLRAAIWVAIGALVAAAIVCVVWVLVDTSNQIIGRAFLTVLLLAAFAGITLLETHLASTRPGWFSLLSMVTWVAILLIGVFKIWLPVPPRGEWSSYVTGPGRFMEFLLIILVLQLAILHIRLFLKSAERNPTSFIKVAAYVTVGLVAILAIMLVVPLVIGELARFDEFYWRLVVAVAILAAVGTAIVPLVNALFAPKEPRPRAASYGGYPPATTGWPTYYDGVTPLPAMPDGTPDWNAYYTGQPTYAPTAGPGYGAGAAHAAAPTAPAAEPASAAPAAPAQAPAAPPVRSAPGASDTSTPKYYNPDAPYSTPQKTPDGGYRAYSAGGHVNASGEEPAGSDGGELPGGYRNFPPPQAP